MKWTSTTLGLTAAVVVVCRPTATAAAVSGRTSRSSTRARRRLQSDDDEIPLAGISIIPTTEGATSNPSNGLTAMDVLPVTLEDTVKNKLEADEQVTGERHGYEYHRWRTVG